jgi:hypothetical protein
MARVCHRGAGQHRADDPPGPLPPDPFRDDALDLGCRDILGTDLQHVLGPVGEREVAVGVDGDIVSGPKPSAFVEALRGRSRLVQVLGAPRPAGCSLDQEVASKLVGADWSA